MAEIQRGDPVEETTLVELLQRAQHDGDHVAFDGLYLLFADRVYRFLLARVGDVELAEEATSQVFLPDRKDPSLSNRPADNVAIFSAWLIALPITRWWICARLRRTHLVNLDHADHVVKTACSIPSTPG
jgi:DNA-directed RNA polymerase specialized sigma24 family protein